MFPDSCRDSDLGDLKKGSGNHKKSDPAWIAFYDLFWA